ncbi:MAG TPA: hypothetical protein DDZ68_10855 [Parvularcula sp.]|nr:hypothetical protein [Parvularcula sp.]
MALDHLLTEARRARLADDYGGAIKLCRAFLDVNPGAPEAESLLGLCEIETGRTEGASRIIKAAEAAPKSAALQLNLSILRERQGDIRGAVVHANSAARLDPRSFEAWAQLGKLLGKGEKLDEAFAALEQALKLRRDHSGVLMLYAVAALETNRLAECAATLDEAEALGLPKSETRRARAHLLRKRGDAPALEAFAEGWLIETPNEAEARIALAYALAEQGYYDRAAAAFAPLAGRRGASADDLAAMGRYKLGARRLEEAAHWFRRALTADPKNAEAAFGLARRSMFLGRMDEAQAWCRRTLEAVPDHADAFGLLTEATGGAISDADLAALDSALQKAVRRPEIAAKLHFARGDALHARKRADDAFAAWSEANALKRARARSAGASYDRHAQSAKVDALIRLFPREQPASFASAGTPSPIFIVGMPRSGTTLLESAICAHPGVDGAGEVPAMPFFLDGFLDGPAARNDGFDALNPAEIEQWRSGYLDQCRRFGWKGARFLTDKQPSNFLGVGFIARLFPAARFLHIRRDPVETGFSIFRRNFAQAWPFTTDLADIAHYYAEHERISAHWRATHPDRVAFVQYEDLIRSFEPEMRRLIAFCGLDWSDDCLRFHEQSRSVMTFSAAQVREPPSLARLSSTGPYRAHLDPLIRALEDFGVDPETGALRTRH